MTYKATEETWDYIIVGAGSAGCVLARRLSDDPDVKVLLLEAGGYAHGWDWRVHMPAAFAYPMSSTTYNWDFATVPQPGLSGRVMPTPRGKVLGGSSSINGMAYVRGHALDYDRWAQDPALAHWSYQHCLPYFRRAETRDLGADAYRGDQGPLRVTTAPGWSPLYDAFVQAGVEAGYNHTLDMNGYCQEGFGPMQMTVHNGVRCGAYAAYLAPIRKRPNLAVRTHAFVHQIRFEGHRAVGVNYAIGRRVISVRAEQRVILSAGAIVSPQLLMLSGIGPGTHLHNKGLTTRVDLPGVGSNLQDHLEIYIQYRCRQPVSLYPALQAHNKMRVGLQWLLFHTGHGATNHFESGGFIRSRAGVQHPDLQYHFAPLAVDTAAQPVVKGHSFQIQVGPMRPRSRGTVRLMSSDPQQPAEIDPHYLEQPEDRDLMRDSIRLTREILHQPAMSAFAGEELAPGPDGTTDGELDAFITQAAYTAFHPSCTCSMGSHELSVVDGNTAVHGVDGLHVVDASIMPTIVSGNLNAPTIMMAEKAADLIAGHKPLPATQTPFWVHPEWQQRQR